jgi:hypothetical protein
MSSYLSVLRKATPADIVRAPFPYLVLKNCLDQELYEELSRTYPSDETIARLNLHREPNGLTGENLRTDISAAMMKDSKHEIPELWQDFISYHVSSSFFEEVVSLFGPVIYENFPWLRRKIRLAEKPGVGIRFDQHTDHQPFSLDCQVGINTPSSSESSVIGPHTDCPKELYAGLLYFKQPGDTASGGDLELYQWHDPKHKEFENLLPVKSCLQRIGVVPYEANTFVFFINTPDSLHGVTPRKPSLVSRRLVNVIGEVYNFLPSGLYEYYKDNGNLMQKVKNKLSTVLG